MKLQTILVMLLATVAACATDPPPPPAQPVPVAADNGQPKMQATLAYLDQARVAVQSAAPNKGGHRVAALALIQQAMGAVQAGMQWAAQHPKEVGVLEGAAPPEPVAAAVPGANRQPRMAAAVVSLREARRQLREARADKGGYRAQALNLINQALAQLRQGIRVANGG